MERCCDLCHITLNKNAVVGDVSAMTPGGVRIGAPAMTSRGLKEADFEQIAEFLHEAMELCKDLQNKHGRLLKDFNKWGLVISGMMLLDLILLELFSTRSCVNVQWSAPCTAMLALAQYLHECKLTCHAVFY